MIHRKYTPTEEKLNTMKKLLEINPEIKNKDYKILFRRQEVIVDEKRFKFRTVEFRGFPAFFLKRV